MRDGDYLDDFTCCVPPTRVRSRRAFITAGVSLLTLPALAHASPSRPGTSGPVHAPQDLKPLLKSLRRRTVSDDVVLAVAEVLARSGIGTYASPVDAGPMVAISRPPSSLKYLRWQVTTMANELAARNGSTVAELDSLIDPFESGVSPYAIIAGYVHDGKSPGGALSFKCGPDPDTMTLVPKLLDDPQGIVVRRVGT